MKPTTKLFVFLAAALVALPASAQINESDVAPVTTSTESGLVTVSSKGSDVRDVLFDLFEQSKKSFVLEPGVRFVLYLSLRDVSFDEALELICATSGLQSVTDNGIYFVTRKKSTLPEAVPAPAIVRKLTEQDLARPVTTKLLMTDLRILLGEMSRQSNVMIEIDENVPKVKVDAVFNGTPLKQALSVLTKAAGLDYSLTDHYTVRIRKAQPSSSAQG